MRKAIVSLAVVACACAALAVERASAKPGVKATVCGAEQPRIDSHWKGKKVAFLGDSITDRNHVGCRRNYWNFLPEELGIDAYVYGRNGWQMGGTYGVQKQAMQLKAEMGDEVDAIFVFAGTNDYNSNVPLGEWFSVAETNVCRGGPPVKVRRRQRLLDDKTFRGRINILLAYLKREFPRQQVVLMTPIHRAFAQFGPKNVQPDESYSNALGLFIDDYVQAVREAGSVWSVPVIDLFADSGLYPCEPAQAMFFHDAKTDMLHPNTDGQRRMALILQYRMLALPSDFKACVKE